MLAKESYENSDHIVELVEQVVTTFHPAGEHPEGHQPNGAEEEVARKEEKADKAV